MGVPLRLLSAHASAPTNKIKTLLGGKVINQTITHDLRPGNKHVTISRVTSELQALIPGVTVRDDIANAKGGYSWAELPLPLDGQEGPILGLRVHEVAFACNSCESISTDPRQSPSKTFPYTTLSRDNLRHHRPKCTSEGGTTSVSAQTFSPFPPYLIYFPVQHNVNRTPAFSQPSHVNQSPSKRSAADILNAKLKLVIGPSQPPTATTDVREFHGFYVEVRIHLCSRQIPLRSSS